MESVRGRKYFWAQRECLVFRKEAPTPEFWDALWREKREADLVACRPPRGNFITRETQAFLPVGSRILEGGCGTGLYARYLAELGYEVVAMDWAEETVDWIRKNIPALKAVKADLRSIPYPDLYFDGYWSLGVIEHFYEGYDPLLGEMARVIRPGGILFLTFPYMSPVRKIVAKLGLFPKWSETHRSEFYQFALDHNQVIRDLCPNFRVVRTKALLGASGLGDLCPFLEPVFDWLRSRGKAGKKVMAGLDRLLSPAFGHIRLLVLERRA